MAKNPVGITATVPDDRVLSLLRYSALHAFPQLHVAQLKSLITELEVPVAAMSVLEFQLVK